jgi:hypothetical protein
VCCSGAAATDRTGQAFAEADDAQSQPSTLRAAAHCAGMTCYFSGVAARLTGEEREDVGSHSSGCNSYRSKRQDGSNQAPSENLSDVVPCDALTGIITVPASCRAGDLGHGRPSYDEFGGQNSSVHS